MSIFNGTREWIYTRRVAGKYQTLHRWSGRLLIGALFVAPWLHWAGQPLVRIDLPARRLYLLGQIFTAQDGFLIALGGLIAAFMLFFVSAVFGRLWCGYFCPQTVFLEEWVRRVELWVEGDGVARARRDAGPWTRDRVLRKGAKVAILTVLAFALSMTLVSYFAGAIATWTGQAAVGHYTLVGVLMGGVLLDWLWFREQLCIYLCPYARFQSALTDADSLTVGFNPQTKIRKGRAAALAGDCIDCNKCVTACPMGIDIRDGFQLECINCARCVDACTDVMGKLGHESHVRYTTINLDEQQVLPVEEQKSWLRHVVRPRTVVYAALITGLAAVLMAGIVLHNPIEVTVNRSPGTLYQLDDHALVRNTYLLRLVNNDPQAAHAFTVEVEGLDQAIVTVPEVTLQPGEDRTVPLIVQLPADAFEVTNTLPVRIVIRTDTEERTVETTFKGPRAPGQG